MGKHKEPSKPLEFPIREDQKEVILPIVPEDPLDIPEESPYVIPEEERYEAPPLEMPLPGEGP